MTDIADELERALIGEEPDWQKTPGEQGLPLDSIQATAWLAHKGRVQRQQAEVKVAFDAAVERMATVANARIAHLAEQEEWLNEALTIYHQIMIAQDPEGSLTIVLPTGVLKSGTWGGDIWDIEDEAAFEAWVIDHLPGAVEYPAPKVSKAEAKKLIKQALVRISDGVAVVTTGDAVPGLTISERPRAFKATPTADES